MKTLIDVSKHAADFSFALLLGAGLVGFTIISFAVLLTVGVLYGPLLMSVLGALVLMGLIDWALN